jgi:hypothetical protein
MRRGGRLAATFLIPTFLVQSTGAADLAFLAPVRAPAALYASPRLPLPSRNAFPIKATAAPRVVLPEQGILGALRDWIAPTVNAWDDWLAQPMDLPDPAQWLSSWDRKDPTPQPAPAVNAVPADSAVSPEVQKLLGVSEVAPDRMLIDHHDFDIAGVWTDLPERGGRPVTHEFVAPDRVPIEHHGFEITCVWPELQARQVVAPRFDGPWHQSNGLRFRINYLKPEGYYTIRRNEVQLTEGSRTWRVPSHVTLAADYLRTYAVYYEGDLVDYEIELENLTGRDLKNLVVFSKQEGFNRRGGVGKPLDSGRLYSLKSLAAGGRAVLMGRARIAGNAAAGSGLEQTHLAMDAADGTRLIDDPQAGIVDPPSSR